MSSSASESTARVALVLALCWPCALASAQSSSEATDRAAARQLASDGFAALERGAPAEAETSFTRAIALYRAPTLFLARGRARLKLSWLVAAGEDFRAAVNSPAEDDEPAAFAQARSDAAKEWAALEPRFPTLTVQLAGARPSQIKVNGTAWPLEATGFARPLDPGNYTVEATDAQGRTYAASTRLEEGKPSVVSLNIPEAGPAAAPIPAATSGAAPVPAATANAAPPATAATTSAAHESSISTATWVSAGITVGLVIGAVVTGVIALDRKAEYDDNNRPDVAHGKKQELHDSANSMALINTVFVGAAVIGAGVTTYLWLSPVESQPQAQASAPHFDGVMANVRLRY